jgi:hypothetical protein
MRPQDVESVTQSTAVDLINELDATANPPITKTLKGYDECFGNGRLDALRAVTKTTSVADDPVPACLEGQD